MTTKGNQIERYYDTHEMPGSEGLAQTFSHAATLMDLDQTIRNIFYGQNVGFTSRSNICLNNRTKEAPDIAVIDGLDMTISQAMAEDYRIGKHGPPPRVAIDITSAITYYKDLEEKPKIYNRMSINECFVYGPKNQPVWAKPWDKFNRLVGWRKNKVSGKYDFIEKDEAGRLWSEELQSWLAMEETELQLYTADGQLRISKAEAGTRRADAEAQKVARLAEKLRQLGINPDDLL